MCVGVSGFGQSPVDIPVSLGVIAYRGSLKPELMELMEPHLDIEAHFKRQERFLVIDCVCKREQEVLGNHDCKMPMKRCDFVGLPPQTPLGETVLDRDEALKLFGELEQMGHVHLAFYGFTMGAEAPQFVGTCNCCGDCCGFSAGPRTSVCRKRHSDRTTGPSLIQKNVFPAACASNAAL